MARKGTRIYRREQGGERRVYKDFRDFADGGGKREALIPKGAKQATTDEKLALALVEELEVLRRRRQRGQPLEDTYLAAYSEHHLVRKARSGSVTAAWLEAAQMHLETAIEFFCDRESRSHVTLEAAKHCSTAARIGRSAASRMCRPA